MSFILITIHDAKNLISADTNGFSDPYCEILFGKRKKKTKTKKKTLNPTWNEEFCLKNTSEYVTLSVYDWDIGSSDDFLGTTSINLSEAAHGKSVCYQLHDQEGINSTQDRGSINVSIKITDTRVKKQRKSKKMNKSSQKEIVARVQEAKATQSLELDLSGVQLTQIPKSISEGMNYLDSFDLGFNSFQEFPVVDAFLSLQILHLEGNQLRNIHPSVGELQRLKELYLNGNQISEIPAEVGNLVKLEKLQLGNNQIKNFFWEVGNLKKLEELNLTGNPVSQIPASIGNCKSLEVLDLSCCELTRLPEEFTLMTRLMEVNLGTNKLECLPESVGRMTRLVELNLADNQLCDLPLTLGYCVGLGKLGFGIRIEGNPIESEKMVSKAQIGVDHLLDYLEKRLATSGAPRIKPLTAPSMGDSDKSDQPKQKKVEQTSAPEPKIEQSKELDQKSIVLKNWCLSTIQELRSFTGPMKETIKNAVQIEQVVPIAQRIRDIKSVSEELKKLLPEQQALQKPTQANDKLNQLKAVVMLAIQEVEVILSGIQRELNLNADIKKILSFVAGLKNLKASF